MALKRRKSKLNVYIFILVLILYTGGQVLIGTYDANSDDFCYTAPADIDFLYYAGILNQLKQTFPPQNPAYGGEILSQSFVQFYPTALISLFVNEYIAMRIMNLVYLILLAIILRRYYPSGWGAGLIGMAAGSVGFGLLNSLGVDLIARGFNHLPFFIALLIAFKETKRKWLRYLCIFGIGWLHAYSALIVLIFMVIRALAGRLRHDTVYEVLTVAAGLITAALPTLGMADKPFYFIFIEGFGFDLSLIWIHALAMIIPVIAAGKRDLYILYAVSLIFGLLFHYNPFFPVFLLYFAGAIGLADLFECGKGRRAFSLAVSFLLMTGFAAGVTAKYFRDPSAYYPHFDNDYQEAGFWLETNSPSEAVLLTIPLDSNWRCRLMEKRAVYLGFISHVAHLGIDWRTRSQIITNYFTNPDVKIGEIDYVVYGPLERQYFPDFSLPYLPAYSDESVTIWEVSN